MDINHCHHTKEDGFFCQAPPLHGRDYCRFHLRALGRRMRMARALARREPYHLVLPILEDINAVQVARMQVLDALAAGLLGKKLGGLLLYGLQQASSDLRSLTAAPCLMVPAGEQREGRAEEYPGFEEEFDLPQDLDLSKPPGVLFPAATAVTQTGPSPYRSKPFDLDEIAPEDVELEEIFRSQGAEAYQRREKEMTAQAIKQVMERKREIQRARYVVEAARRNEERMFGTAEERARNQAEVERERVEAVAQHRAKAAAAAESEAAKKPSATVSDAAASAAEGTSSATEGAAKKPPEAAPAEEGAAATGSVDN